MAPDWKVEPLSREYCNGAVPPLAAMVIDPVAAPLQSRSVLVKVKLGTGGEAMVTVLVVVHAFASFMVTVKVPALMPVKFPVAWKVVPLMEKVSAPVPPDPVAVIVPSLPGTQETTLVEVTVSDNAAGCVMVTTDAAEVQPLLSFTFTL